MKYDFETSLKNALKISITNKKFPDYEQIDLSEEDIHLLHKKIEILPEEATELILGKYYFELEYDDIEIFYGIKDAEKKLNHYECVLAYSMGLEDHHRISQSSMVNVSWRMGSDLVTSSSKNKESKSLHKAHSLKKAFKIVLIAAIIMALSITSALAFNKDFRERIVSWVIEKHNEYSMMVLETENTDDNLEPVTEELMSEYTPEYIPKGMEIKEQFKGDIVRYTYASDHKILNILLSEPDQYAYIDTENKIIKKIKVNDKKALWFEDDDEGNLCFTIDGIFVYIHGNLKQEELIKIAENIKRKNK